MTVATMAKKMMGLDETAATPVHRIRITLTSRDVKAVEKGTEQFVHHMYSRNSIVQ